MDEATEHPHNGQTKVRACQSERRISKGGSFSGKAKEKIGRTKEKISRGEEKIGLENLSPGKAEDFSGKGEEKISLFFLRDSLKNRL